MPQIHDRAAIRRLLAADPAWSLYALGDLAPGYFEHCKWWGTECGDALVLIYRASTPPVLFACGPAASVSALVEEIAEPRVYFHVRPEVAEELAGCYRAEHLKPMWRMVLDRERFRSAPGCGERLGAADVPAILRLYEDGRERGETPDFFFPSMVENGVFFGVREGSQLVAVAGTHLAVPEEGVGAIGNVYTRRDRRGRGLASALTSAVAAELLRMGVETVALNVSQSNATAAAIYERIGFVKHCGYVEGIAEFTTLHDPAAR